MVYTNEETVIHVRFNGRSFDVPLSALVVGARSDDEQIKRNLARHLEVNVSRLRRLCRGSPRQRQPDDPAGSGFRLIV